MASPTRRVRFRSAVLLAHLSDPIEPAEDADVLQIISGGRLDL